MWLQVGGSVGHSRAMSNAAQSPATTVTTSIRRRFPLMCVALAVALATGCAAGDESHDVQESDIIDGRKAVEYAEAVHVNRIDEYGPAGGCSGVLVAPRIVLTAGHCIAGSRAWGIYAPFAGGHGQISNHAEMFDWYDYEAAGETYPTHLHDIGIIVLDDPIELATYPVLASEPAEHGSWATIVGRVKNGFNSPDWLFASDPVVVLQEWPSIPQFTGRYYTVPEVTIQRGDSGGPVYALDPAAGEGAPRTLIALVATTNGAFRIETVRDWILDAIAAHDD